jgi:DNA-binding GntR family transcriptional regulator
LAHGTSKGDAVTAVPQFRTKADVVYELLRERILSGDLRPGDRVPINKVARELGISDIPAREGVKRLEAIGLVEFAIHKGAVVTTLGRHEVTELFAIRTELEALAMRNAAQEIGGEQLAELRTTLEQMAAAAEQCDVDEFDLHVRAFHMTAYGAQSFRKLSTMLEQLWDSTDWCRRILLDDAKMVSASLADHKLIYDALEQHDGEAAAVFVRAQKHRTVAWFLRRMDEREKREQNDSDAP